MTSVDPNGVYSEPAKKSLKVTIFPDQYCASVNKVSKKLNSD